MLKKHFDRIVVISLPVRANRRERLMHNLISCGLAEEKDITWFEAVDGRKEKIPSWWKQGAGAWGCRFSQLKVIEEAQTDGLSNVLILEDDAVFHPRAAEWLEKLMPEIPDDWGQFFLGGEHLHKPVLTENPKFFQGSWITRTHAYAVHSRIFSQIISQVKDDVAYKKNPGWHVDHQYGWCQKNNIWKAYAPAWWLAGQDSGQSDIAFDDYPRRWWQMGLDFWKIPFVQVPHVFDDKHLFFAKELPAKEPMELALWFRRVAYEAWSQGRLPSCVSTHFSTQEIAKFWPAGSRSMHDISDLAQLADYPANGLFPHPFSQTN